MDEETSDPHPANRGPGGPGRTGWVIGAGITAALVCVCGAVLWWKLPDWKPEWVIGHSPFIEPALRARVALGGDGYIGPELGDRFRNDWAAEATPMLVRILTTRSGPIRNLALALISDYGDDRAADAVLAELGMPVSDTMRCLEFIRRVQPPHALETLHAYFANRVARFSYQTDSDEWFLMDDPESDAAIELLALYKDPEALPLYLRTLAQGAAGDPVYAGDMIASLAGRPSSVRLALSAIFAEKNPGGAAAVLTALNDPRCRSLIDGCDLIPFLLEMLDHPHASVVVAATDLLASLLGEGFIPRLWRQIGHHQTVVSDFSLRILYGEKHAALIPFLQRDWPSLDAALRIRFIDTISGIDGADALGMLHHALADDEWMVGLRARERLREHPQAVDRALVLHYVRDGRSFSRAHAANLCGLLGWREAIDDISRLLDSSEPEVVIEGVLALGRLRARPSALRVAALLTHEDWHIQEASILALGLMGDHAQAPLLSEASRNDNRTMASLALASLSHLTENGLDPSIYREALSAAQVMHGADIGEGCRDWFREELALAITPATPTPADPPAAAPPAYTPPPP